MPAGSADVAVGIMDPAYFKGRRELLEFFNELLDLNLAKIEQTASGAVACQMTDYIFPGSIPMHRVNWEAKSDYEYIQNYKLLQIAFTKNRVQRHVDVDKLIRAKYQDNLEFCQWLMAFFDQAGVHRADYDAAAVRSKGKGGKKAGAFFGKTAASYGSKPIPRAPAGSSRPASRPLRERPSASQQGTKPTTSKSVAVAADAELTKKNTELTTKVTDLETNVVDIERERDFYFQKLRDIEVMLQVHQEKGEEGEPDALIAKVFKVLYAVAEDGMVVTDDGEIVDKAEQELEDALFEEEQE